MIGGTQGPNIQFTKEDLYGMVRLNLERTKLNLMNQVPNYSGMQNGLGVQLGGLRRAAQNFKGGRLNV